MLSLVQDMSSRRGTLLSIGTILPLPLNQQGHAQNALRLVSHLYAGCFECTHLVHFIVLEFIQRIFSCMKT